MKNVLTILIKLQPNFKTSATPEFSLMIHMYIRGVKYQPAGTYKDLVNNGIFPGQRLPGQITANTPTSL